MNDVQVIDIAVQALLMGAKLGGPLLLAALVIGVIVSLFQAVTQIQEPTLTFVPKIVGVTLVGLVAGNWMLQELLTWVRTLWTAIPNLI